MKLNQLIEKIPMKVQTPATNLNVEVTGGYISDLLSDVMAHAKKGDIWITLQIHQNTVAVATLKELAGIILINGKQPAPETIKKAEEEGVPILTSESTAFELICELCKLGISGSR
ncbi:serine kinase [candidate division KSB1 bacterium]|nr:serine kinase [candidate division KSB1 bacterium]